MQNKLPQREAMRLRRPAWLLLLACALVAAGGCRWWGPKATPLPVIFSAAPTLDQAMSAVNANTARVQQLDVIGGRMSVNGLPSLSTSISLDRPNRFRLRGETSITGPEVDLGSNEELFWIWAKRNEPAAVLYARHDRFQQSPARQLMPIEPQWLVESLGLVEFDPRCRHEGPFAHGAGKLEIRSYVPTPAGEMLKLIVLNDRYGYVEEEYVYDVRGTPVAAARLSGQQYYADYQVTLPKRVELNLPSAHMALRLDIPQHLLNQPTPDAGMRYQLPQIDGYPLVDISDPNFRPPMPTAMPAPQQPPSVPAAAPRPAPATYPQLGYRGYEMRR